MYPELLLAWLPALQLWREERIELGNSLLVVARSVNIGRVIEPLSAVESTVGQLFDEERGREDIPLEADVELLAALVAACDVVVGVAEVDHRIIAHIPSDSERMLKQSLADASALILGEHAQRTHSDDILHAALLIDEFSLAVHDSADDLTVSDGYEVELGDKIGVIAHYMDEVVLEAARHREVPESLTSEIFDFTEVVFVFSADDDVGRYYSLFFLLNMVDKTREVCVG